MDEKRALELYEKLGEHRYAEYHDPEEEGDPPYLILDGYFTADELEAIAWLLRNKPERLG